MSDQTFTFIGKGLFILLQTLNNYYCNSKFIGVMNGRTAN